MNTKLKLVKLNSTLKSFSHIEDLKKEVKEYLMLRFGICLDKVAQDPSFLELICCLVETLYIVPKIAKQKIDKKKLVIELICELIPSLNNVKDIEHLDKSIEYLHSKGVIVGVTKTTEVYNYVKGCFLKN
jgi:hypothetical protein